MDGGWIEWGWGYASRWRYDYLSDGLDRIGYLGMASNLQCDDQSDSDSDERLRSQEVQHRGGASLSRTV